jgi:SAM-dependent methyltransferase
MARAIQQCRCCGSDDLFPYLNLGEQPLANNYHRGETPLATFPLTVNLCRGCSHSQLAIVVDPDLMYRNYLYVSGTSQTFRRHFKALACDAVERVRPPHRVLDVACNDGTLLECFRELGCSIRGVDPAENLRAITQSKGIPVDVAYWGPEAAARLDGRFNLITATNVYAHVDDCQGFLRACRRVLLPEGLVILEFPYFADTLAKCEFDQIYHEHLSYFLARSFRCTAERAGFRIEDLVRTPNHGGSVRFFLRPQGEGRRTDDCAAVHALIEEESVRGLHSERAYRQFAYRIEDTRDNLRATVAERRAAGKTLIGYGASAKGNTMLNYFGLDLAYIVDDNPMKWGYLTPGRSIPIAPPERMADEPGALGIVILAWNFYEEIRRKIAAIRGQQVDECIRYVPSVTVDPVH